MAPICHRLSSDTWSGSRFLSRCRCSSPGWMCWWGRWCLPVLGSVLSDAFLLHPSQPSFPRAGISLGFFPSETHLEELDFKKKKLFIFNWRITSLQYCADFCHTSTWISHRFTYISSLLNPPRTSHPSRLPQSPGLSSLDHIANAYWSFVLQMAVVYMFPCYCLHSSHPLPPHSPCP